MAEFSGKILSAVFVTEEHDLIKIRYEDGDVISIFNVGVDETNQDYKDLLDEGWDLQRITDETAEAKKAESHAFNLMVNQAAQQILEETRATRKQEIEAHQQILEETSAKRKQEIEAQFQSEINNNKNLIRHFKEKTEDYFAHIAEDTDKDTLFRFKLWALETKDLKESSKELKSKMRKAKTMIEGFAVLHEIRSSK
jgi:hypothetical protein